MELIRRYKSIINELEYVFNEQKSLLEENRELKEEKKSLEVKLKGEEKKNKELLKKIEDLEEKYQEKVKATEINIVKDELKDKEKELGIEIKGYSYDEWREIIENLEKKDAPKFELLILRGLSRSREEGELDDSQIKVAERYLSNLKKKGIEYQPKENKNDIGNSHIIIEEDDEINIELLEKAKKFSVEKWKEILSIAKEKTSDTLLIKVINEMVMEKKNGEIPLGRLKLGVSFLEELSTMGVDFSESGKSDTPEAEVNKLEEILLIDLKELLAYCEENDVISRITLGSLKFMAKIVENGNELDENQRYEMKECFSQAVKKGFQSGARQENKKNTKAEESTGLTGNTTDKNKIDELLNSRVKLKNFKDKDWKRLLTFDKEYNVFSNREKQLLNNLRMRIEHKISVNERDRQGGEDCLGKAVEEGYSLYRLSADEWRKVTGFCDKEKVLSQIDISFLISTVRLYEKYGTLSKDQFKRLRVIAAEINKRFDSESIEGNQIKNNLEEAEVIEKFSWKVHHKEKMFIKVMDKSAFLNRGTGIPLELKKYFEIEELKEGDRLETELEYKGICYSAYFSISNSRARLMWGKPFEEAIGHDHRDTILGLKYASDLETGNLLPEMVMIKEGDIYKVTLDGSKEEAKAESKITGDERRRLLEEIDKMNYLAWNKAYIWAVRNKALNNEELQVLKKTKSNRLMKPLNENELNNAVDMYSTIKNLGYGKNFKKEIEATERNFSLNENKVIPKQIFENSVEKPKIIQQSEEIEDKIKEDIPEELVDILF